MYKEFYGLKEEPFSISPDPDFMYWSQKHLAAFRHLMYSIHRKKGLILLTGEIGAGKTTLINALLKEIGERAKTASVANSEIDVSGLFEFIFHAFGLPLEENNKVKNLIRLNEFLVRSRNDDKDVVIILDEAHNFSNEILEEIRLLSNIETPKEKLLQIILVGQPLLLDRINSIGFEQVRQRVGMSYYLRSLSKAETNLYIKKRLEISGAAESSLFNDEAIEEVFVCSQGIPRVINTICDNALLFGAAEQRPQIDAGIVRRVVDSLYLHQVPGSSKMSSLASEDGLDSDMDEDMEELQRPAPETSPYARIARLQEEQAAEGSPFIGFREPRSRQRITLFVTAACLAIVVLSGLMLARVEVVQQALTALTDTLTGGTREAVPPEQPAGQSSNLSPVAPSEPSPRLPPRPDTAFSPPPTMSPPATAPSDPTSGATPGVARPTSPPATAQELPVRFVNKPEPEYPPVARRLGWEGSTLLLLELRADGTVGEVNVVATSNYPVLDDAAKQAAKKWTHVPARRDGVPVTQWITQTIPFKLNDAVPSQGEVIRQAQERLKSAGFYPGPIDGFLGPRTREALRKYQENKGLAPNGELDKTTREALALE